MLLLLPLVFFLLIAIAMGVLRLRGMRMAYLWLLPAIIALVCWVVITILPIPTAGSVFHIPGLFSLLIGDGLSLNLNEASWGFIYLVVSLVLVYFLTMLIRLDEEKRTLFWIGWLILSAIAILTFAAGNLTTLMLTWFLFDILDYLFTFLILSSNRWEGSLMNIYSARFISLGLLFISNIFILPIKTQWLPKPPTPIIYFLLVFAGMFRMGLLPIQIEKRETKEKESSFTFLKNNLLVLSGFSLLSFLPAQYLSSTNQILLTAIFFLLSLIFVFLSVMNEPNSMNLWVKSILCLGCITVFSGSPIALVGWGGIVLLGSGISYFYSQRSKRNRVLVWLSVLSLSGLPFSIGALGLAGLTTTISNFWIVPGLFVYALLLYDYLHKVLIPNEETKSITPLFSAFYLFGLVQFVLSPFAILIKNSILAANTIRFWWTGIASLAFCLSLFLLEKRIQIGKTAIKKIMSRLIDVFSSVSYKWIENVWNWFFWFLSAIVQFLTRLLEGEGGVIWVIVILSLLISLFRIGRA